MPFDASSMDRKRKIEQVNLFGRSSEVTVSRKAIDCNTEAGSVVAGERRRDGAERDKESVLID